MVPQGRILLVLLRIAFKAFCEAVKLPLGSTCVAVTSFEIHLSSYYGLVKRAVQPSEPLRAAVHMNPGLRDFLLSFHLLPMAGCSYGMKILCKLSQPIPVVARCFCSEHRLCLCSALLCRRFSPCLPRWSGRCVA